jgi:hypothetical protein
VRASLCCRYLSKGMSTRLLSILNIIVSLDCLRWLSSDSQSRSVAYSWHILGSWSGRHNGLLSSRHFQEFVYWIGYRGPRRLPHIPGSVKPWSYMRHP